MSIEGVGKTTSSSYNSCFCNTWQIFKLSPVLGRSLWQKALHHSLGKPEHPGIWILFPMCQTKADWQRL